MNRPDIMTYRDGPIPYLQKYIDDLEKYCDDLELKNREYHPENSKNGQLICPVLFEQKLTTGKGDFLCPIRSENTGS